MILTYNPPMPTPNNRCCHKCHDVDYEKTYPAHTATFFCSNKKCECHNQADKVEASEIQHGPYCDDICRCDLDNQLKDFFATFAFERYGKIYIGRFDKETGKEELLRYEGIALWLRSALARAKEAGRQQGLAQQQNSGRIMYQNGMRDERKAWLKRQRCEECGKEIVSTGMTGTCGECFEE